MASSDDNVKLRLRDEYAHQQMAFTMRGKLKEKLEAFSQIRKKNGGIVVDKIFGRWLMTMQLYDWQQMDAQHPLFPRQPLKDDRSREELVRMLEESFNAMSKSQATEIADDMLKSIKELQKESCHDTNAGEVVDAIQVHFNVTEKGGKLTIGPLSTPRNHRIRFLVEQFGPIDTALMYLRYSPLNLFKGGESGMSVTVLNALQKIGQTTYEGFASPLNCRLLGRPDIGFCSLFEDTDATFGSMGNFFHIDLADHPGGWILNPPFVEPVLEATARRVVKLLDDVKSDSFWFYITFPMWTDNDGWKILNRSKRRKKRRDFRPNSFVQQDCYGKVNIQRTGVCIFVLGDLPTGVDLKRLWKCIDGAGVDLNRATDDWLVACGGAAPESSD